MRFNHAVMPFLCALFCATACATAFAASRVTELEPVELEGFVRKHKLVAVQFTSPDKRCDYCVGADKTFDGAAALNKNPKMSFARVQWPVYAHWPGFISFLPVLKGAPAQMLYVDGKVHRRAAGKPDTPELMLKQFQDMVKQPADDQNDDKVYVGPDTKPPSKEPLREDQDWEVVLYFRSWYLDRVVEHCGKYFPDQLAAYQDSAQAWKDRHHPELVQAQRTLHEHRNEADLATVQAIYHRGQKAMHVLQVQTLNVPTNRAPRPEECVRVIDAIVDLPMRD